MEFYSKVSVAMETVRLSAFPNQRQKSDKDLQPEGQVPAGKCRAHGTAVCATPGPRLESSGRSHKSLNSI
jgi:hypothetical protein